MKYVKYLSLFFFFFFPLFSLPCSDSHLPHEPHTHLSFLTHPNPLGLSPPALRTAPNNSTPALDGDAPPQPATKPPPWPLMMKLDPTPTPPARRPRQRSLVCTKERYFRLGPQGQRMKPSEAGFFTCRLREHEYEASRVDLYLRDLFGWAYPKTTLSMLFWNRYQTGP